jgi:hypothetical protein
MISCFLRAQFVAERRLSDLGTDFLGGETTHETAHGLVPIDVRSVGANQFGRGGNVQLYEYYR